MKIMIFNVGGPFQPGRTLPNRMHYISGVMDEEGVEVGLFQETTAGPFAFVFGVYDGAKTIANDLGFEYKSDKTWGRFGIQWRTSIVAPALHSHDCVHFPSSDPKGATFAKYNDLQLVSVHLNPSPNTAWQLHATMSKIPYGPAVVGGDLNDSGQSILPIIDYHGFKEAPVGDSIDRLFYRGFEFVQAEVAIPNLLGISDHPCAFIIEIN